MKLLIWVTFATTLSTFILKLIYIFVYNKFFRKNSDKAVKNDVENIDYFGMDEY